MVAPDPPTFHQETASNQVLTLLAFIFLALVVPILLLAAAITPLEPTQIALHALIIGYSAAMLSVLLAQGKPNWFATVFWLFSYVWLGLAGMAQAFAGRDPFNLPVTGVADTMTTFIIFLGMIAWQLVYRVTSRWTTRTELRPGRVVTPRGTILTFWVAVVVTPLALAYLGDVMVFWSTRVEASASVTEATGGSLAVGGLVTAFAQVPPAVALFAITLMFQTHKQLRYRPAWWVMSLLVLGLNVLVNSPVGNSRFWSGTVIIGWLLCWEVFRTARGYRTLVVALLVGLTIVFPYTDYFRTPDGVVQTRAPYQFMVQKLDYDAVAQIRNAATVYERNGPANGAQLVSAVGFAIPRSVWTSKAEPTGSVIARGIGYHFENLSAPLWAEGWIDWGPVGAVIYPALFGVVGGLGDRRFRAVVASTDARLALIAMPALAIYSLILIRGSLLGTVAKGAFLAVALLLISSRCDQGPSRAHGHAVPKPL